MYIKFLKSLLILKLCSVATFLNCFSTTKIEESSINPEKTKIWGPGLYADKIVLPVRYFYIQPADENGNAINSSVSSKFDVDILGTSPAGKCRVRIEQLNRRDGINIVRYKIFNICLSMEIHVKYNSRHVAQSPYRILGPVYSEKCQCPQALKEWLYNLKCNSSYNQIDSDLRPFKTVNFSEIRPKFLAALDNPHIVSICDYRVKDNLIFRKCYGQHTGFKMFIDSILTTLVRIVKLPDLEFIVNLGDWPLVKRDRKSKIQNFPVFSWCGSEDSLDIVMPTYDITESSLEGMSRVSIDIMSVQNTRTSWSEKIPKAFWRGRDSRRERLNLVDIARKNPDLFNVSLTNFFFFRNEESKYGPRSPHISFYEFFNHKYQINVDGTVAAYRFPYLLASNSVVFKQESPFYEHFYKQVFPMRHYIPVKRDLSNLVDQIIWAKQNDKKARKIADNAQTFANENLTADQIFCYYVILFQEWSKRLLSDVEIDADMDQLPIDEQECDCTEIKHTRDEF